MFFVVLGQVQGAGSVQMDKEVSGTTCAWPAVKFTTTASAALRTLKTSAPPEPRQESCLLCSKHFLSPLDCSFLFSALRTQQKFCHSLCKYVILCFHMVHCGITMVLHLRTLLRFSLATFLVQSWLYVSCPFSLMVCPPVFCRAGHGFAWL